MVDASDVISIAGVIILLIVTVLIMIYLLPIILVQRFHTATNILTSCPLFANKTFANRTFAIGERPLHFRQFHLRTFANWRKSTELSPIHTYTFANWRKSTKLSTILAKLHYTFLNTTESQPNYRKFDCNFEIEHKDLYQLRSKCSVAIGEGPLTFRQYWPKST
jgi:hypothetical protein